MKVLLPLDDSPSSERAMHELLCRHLPNKVWIKLLGVVEPLCFANEPQEAYASQIAHADETRKRHFEHLFEKVRSQIHSQFPHARVDTEIRHGNAAQEIVCAAKEWSADKIMIGAHGHDSCPHNLPGSTSRVVVHHAPCSVEVLRHEEASKSL